MLHKNKGTLVDSNVYSYDTKRHKLKYAKKREDLQEIYKKNKFWLFCQETFWVGG